MNFLPHLGSWGKKKIAFYLVSIIPHGVSLLNVLSGSSIFLEPEPNIKKEVVGLPWWSSG